MGAAASQPAMQQHRELLARLAGPDPVEHQDVFWKQLLLFTTPLCSFHPQDVHAALLPHCQQLRESTGGVGACTCGDGRRSGGGTVLRLGFQWDLYKGPWRQQGSWLAA